ncbi:MAG TPA: GAF domain-containing sensor histidine kinase [Kofleriaceae bacterium]|nr:GAF domain-containing sensor histidine kinase [Kofleriaceae bacterium]
MVQHTGAAERLVAVVQELSLARDLTNVMAIVRTAARQLTGADGATFVLRDHTRCYYADEDAIAPLWKGQRFPMEACISGWAMIHREPVAIPDIYDDARVPADAYRPTFVKSLVMVPIRTAAPVGAIGTYWAQPHRASPGEIELLSTLANSTSIAMENVQLYQELEQRVEQRTADLVRVQRQKDEMAALLVHDLRSPANGIMLASAVRMRRKDISDADRLHWQNVYSSAEAIHRMSMNLLDVMRSEDGTFAVKPSEVPLPRLIREVSEQMTPLAQSQEVQLQVDLDRAPATVDCDPELVRRVLQNLTDNALRYTPEGGAVTIAARAIDDEVEVRVIDDGVGVPPEMRTAVFDKWTRLKDGHDRSASGRGLGLAFCRLAVEAHGGTITIEAHEPHGAEFVVRLPRARDLP